MFKVRQSYVAGIGKSTLRLPVLGNAMMQMHEIKFWLLVTQDMSKCDVLNGPTLDAVQDRNTLWHVHYIQ